MIEIREFSDVSDPELVSAWRSLEAAGACPSLFVSRAWVGVWSRRFAGDSVPTILVGYDGGVPVGLAPLFRGRKGLTELPVNFLSLRAEFLLVEERGEDFVPAALRHLRRDGRSLFLRNLPKDSASLRALAGCSRSAGYLRGEFTSRVTPYVDTSGRWEDYLAGVPRKRVVRWERRIRKLERQGDMRITRYDASTDVDRLVEGIIDVDSRSWRDEQGTSIRGRGLDAFYRELCRVLADEGWFKPFWLEHEGRMTAFVLGAVHGGAYYALKTAYDDSYAKLSPGTCLFYEAISDAFRTGLARVDFLGESARWKEEWATGHRAHVNVRLHPMGVAGLVKHLADSCVRPLARKILQRE